MNLFGHLSVFEGSKCEINRRGFALRGIVASGVSVVGSSLLTEPAQGQFSFLACFIMRILRVLTQMGLGLSSILA